MKRCETIRDLRTYFKSVTSGCAGDTIFMAKASLYSCELLTELMKSIKGNGRPHKKPTRWQRFFGQSIRAGKTARQAADEWKRRK
jgi:hypothetical protein